ncbi:hypothetical protein D3C73_1271460 [compost metagenome]
MDNGPVRGLRHHIIRYAVNGGSPGRDRLVWLYQGVKDHIPALINDADLDYLGLTIKPRCFGVQNMAVEKPLPGLLQWGHSSLLSLFCL